MIIEGTDFLKVNHAELRMTIYSSENITECISVEIINDSDIEEEEEFTLILDTTDPAVNATSRLATVIISIDLTDG